MKLTSKERIMRIFQNKEIDRPSLKLWGAGIYEPYDPLPSPAYEPVAKLASEISDLYLGAPLPCDMITGTHREVYFETWAEATSTPLWENVHSIYHTPKGDLHAIDRVSTTGEPGTFFLGWARSFSSSSDESKGFSRFRLSAGQAAL